MPNKKKMMLLMQNHMNHMNHPSRKRFHKNEDEESDPRKRGKNLVENIKGGIKGAIRFVTDPVVNTYRGVRDNVKSTYRGVRDNVKSRYETGRKAVEMAPKEIGRIYESGRTGKGPREKDAGKKLVQNIGSAAGYAQGIDEALGYIPSKVSRKIYNTTVAKPVREAISSVSRRVSGQTTKRATPVRAKSISNSRQGGFVNGKPVSIKKMASANKYYK